ASGTIEKEPYAGSLHESIYFLSFFLPGKHGERRCGRMPERQSEERADAGKECISRLPAPQTRPSRRGFAPERNDGHPPREYSCCRKCGGRLRHHSSWI